MLAMAIPHTLLLFVFHGEAWRAFPAERTGGHALNISKSKQTGAPAP